MQMMIINLALKNIKKSFKDYSIYFITIVIAISVFYIFNSIGSQKILLDLSDADEIMFDNLDLLIIILSVFVSIVFSFLIIYANNFIIRKRKKEIGLYMLLGMKKRKVSQIIALENIFVGLFSLIIGCTVGIFLSQFLSIITANLFEVKLVDYKFILSTDALFKTVLCFVIIFTLVILFNSIILSKYKLINLLNAQKTNEKLKVKNLILLVFLFILSILFIGYGYYYVLENGILKMDKKFTFAFISGIIGTFLLFSVLSTILDKIIKLNKNFYVKNLNFFIFRQISSKINTLHITMSIISIMIFLTIIILTTGISINKQLVSEYDNASPFDATIKINNNKDVVKSLKNKNFNIEKYSNDYKQFSLYISNENFYENNKFMLNLLSEIFNSATKFDDKLSNKNTNINLIKISEYNKLLKLEGKKTINCHDNEIIIHSIYDDNINACNKILKMYINENNKINISNKEYSIYENLSTGRLITSPTQLLIFALIVPDDAIKDQEITESILNLNLLKKDKLSKEKFSNDLDASIENKDGKIVYATSDIVKSIAIGYKAILTYIGIYLGLIFLVTSSVILALQQLSEITENKERYTILNKIGINNQLINKVLFKQISIYFLIPFSIAVLHSLVGIKGIIDSITEIGYGDILTSIIYIFFLILLIYGSYFIATYNLSKKIILKK
jgi:putative ABC transport system permease protein